MCVLTPCEDLAAEADAQEAHARVLAHRPAQPCSQVLDPLPILIGRVVAALQQGTGTVSIWLLCSALKRRRAAVQHSRRRRSHEGWMGPPGSGASTHRDDDSPVPPQRLQGRQLACPALQTRCAVGLRVVYAVRVCSGRQAAVHLQTASTCLCPP